MQTKHTPGPWFARGSTISAPSGTGEGHTFTLAELGGIYPEKAANARLLAEAPAMLEALRKAEGWVSRTGNGKPMIDRTQIAVYEEIRAILARIEGKQ